MSSTEAGRERLCAALDVSTALEAHALAKRLGPHVGVLKVGLELFVAEGYAAIEQVRAASPDSPIFLDLKLCDIPETVAGAVRSAARARPRFLTVHASGGREMLKRAVEAAALGREGSGEGGMQILAVTVLTSLDERDLGELGVNVKSAGDHALRLAHLAWEAGVRGFVCSAQEVERFRAELPQAYLVTPGIRPGAAPRSGVSSEDQASGDQKRVASPAAAIRAGADLLVIGRPLRDATDPAAAAAAIVDEIEQALAARTGRA